MNVILIPVFIVGGMYIITMFVFFIWVFNEIQNDKYETSVEKGNDNEFNINNLSRNNNEVLEDLSCWDDKMVDEINDVENHNEVLENISCWDDKMIDEINDVENHNEVLEDMSNNSDRMVDEIRDIENYSLEDLSNNNTIKFETINTDKKGSHIEGIWYPKNITIGAAYVNPLLGRDDKARYVPKYTN